MNPGKPRRATTRGRVSQRAIRGGRLPGGPIFEPVTADSAGDGTDDHRLSGGTAGVDTDMSHRSGASAPVRTCVGCRARESSSVLLRIVARQRDTDGSVPAGSVLIPDPEARLCGRGAWIHASRHCLRSAERRRAFGRALRTRGNPDAVSLTDYIETIDPAERDRNGR